MNAVHCNVMCSLDKISKAGISVVVGKGTRDVTVIIGEALPVRFERFMDRMCSHQFCV